MKISVTVKTRARKEYVKKIDDSTFEIGVSALPIDGRANKAIVGLLSDYFDVPKSTMTIVSGASAKRKIIEIG